MSMVLGVLAAAVALSGMPQLPERGLTLETDAGVTAIGFCPSCVT